MMSIEQFTVNVMNTYIGYQKDSYLRATTKKILARNHVTMDQILVLKWLNHSVGTGFVATYS